MQCSRVNSTSHPGSFTLGRRRGGGIQRHFKVHSHRVKVEAKAKFFLRLCHSSKNSLFFSVNSPLLLFTCLDQDLEKDYYFGSPSTNNMADLRWFALGLGSAGEDFSLGFWFRYFRNGGTGTILAMYAKRYVYQVSLQHRQTHRLFFQRKL